MLKASDRCDKGDCGAQAWVEVIIPVEGKKRDLIFCKHHFNRMEAIFVGKGYEIRDHSGGINKKPSMSV